MEGNSQSHVARPRNKSSKKGARFRQKPRKANGIMPNTSAELGSAPFVPAATTSESTHGADKHCIICTEPIQYFAFGKCNHREICALCTIRSRCLYNNQTCCVCKTPLEDVVVTKDEQRKFDAFLKTELFQAQDRLPGMYCDDQAYLNWLSQLFDIVCPLRCGAPQFKSLGKLKHHVRSEHGKAYCDLCLRHRKVFLHEQRLYEPSDVQTHLAKGDSNNPEIPLHPLCQFCNEHYYDNDELYKHLKDKHYSCSICERNGILYQYYAHFPALESHYRKAHYLCEEPGCTGIVFSTEIDLRAHQVAKHLHDKKLSQAEKRQAAKIELNFSYAPREGGAAGRRRKQDRENGDVAEEAAATTPTAAVATTTTTPTATTAAPAATAPSEPLHHPHERDQAKKELERRNKELILQIKDLLGEEQFKEFRKVSGDFKTGKVSPQTYYKLVMSLFPSDRAPAVFTELVELLPDRDKAAALLACHEKAVKLQQEFPALAEGEPRRTVQPKKTVWDRPKIPGTKKLKKKEEKQEESDYPIVSVVMTPGGPGRVSTFAWSAAPQARGAVPPPPAPAAMWRGAVNAPPPLDPAAFPSLSEVVGARGEGDATERTAPVPRDTGGKKARKKGTVLLAFG